jgi:BirA family transcriptional regulator, biotin operon repressor / biotin---[acetyl-CoA-carboxylase] ligase
MASLQEDEYDVHALDAALADTPFAGKIRYFQSLSSTNLLAMQDAEKGVPHGTVYLAEEQTAGKGRAGHSWYSAPGIGLYVSIVLRPQMAPADVLWLSLAAGLAARTAVQHVSTVVPDIRWPNDLLLGKKKFGGILTELNAEVTRVRHAVVGIGINVHQRQFPEEIVPIATSLALETSSPCRRQDLLLALLQSLHKEVLALNADTSLASTSILERLKKASSWIQNKLVHVDEAEGYSGLTAGLDARGFLRVHTPSGLRTVLSGGVREVG